MNLHFTFSAGSFWLASLCAGRLLLCSSLLPPTPDILCTDRMHARALLDQQCDVPSRFMAVR